VGETWIKRAIPNQMNMNKLKNKELSVSDHYDETYFSWHGKFQDRSWANATHFNKYCKSNSRVLDFGCGAAAILDSLDVGEKHGFEPNEAAAEVATKKGIVMHPSLKSIPDNYFDVIISNSALEHCLTPYEDLKILSNKLKPDGLAVFVVPCETIRVKWKPKDHNWHLFTWSPMCLGNLFSESGYDVIESKRLKHRWPPKSGFWVRIVPRKVFQFLCIISGHLPAKIYQTRVVARRKNLTKK
jgi:SAM-dependent methyltransferase